MSNMIEHARRSLEHQQPRYLAPERVWWFWRHDAALDAAKALARGYRHKYRVTVAEGPHGRRFRVAPAEVAEPCS